MRKYGLSIFFLAILAVAITLACGSSPPPRALQSVSLSPPSADAQGSPVQFTATGYFNQQPSPEKLTVPSWGACNPNQPYLADYRRFGQRRRLGPMRNRRGWHLYSVGGGRARWRLLRHRWLRPGKPLRRRRLMPGYRYRTTEVSIALREQSCFLGAARRHSPAIKSSARSRTTS